MTVATVVALVVTVVTEVGVGVEAVTSLMADEVPDPPIAIPPAPPPLPTAPPLPLPLSAPLPLTVEVEAGSVVMCSDLQTSKGWWLSFVI